MEKRVADLEDKQSQPIKIDAKLFGKAFDEIKKKKLESRCLAVNLGR